MDTPSSGDEADQPVPPHAPPVYDSLPALPIMSLHEDFQSYSPVPPEGWMTADNAASSSGDATEAAATEAAVAAAEAPVASALADSIPASVQDAAGSAVDAAKSAAAAASQIAQAAAASASAASQEAGLTDAVASAAGSLKAVAATAEDAAKEAAATAVDLAESTGAVDAAKSAAASAADSLKALASDPNTSLQSAAAGASSAAASAATRVSSTAKNAAAAGLSALPISAIAGVAAAASSAPLLSPVSPMPISLFTQLRTAQNSEGGTAAAAAILLAKANELMELAGPEETEAEEEERIRREEEALDSAAAKRSQQAGASAARAPASLSAEAAKAVPLDADTRSRLSCQAEELRGYSELLLASEGGAGAAAVWSVLEDKYNQSGSGLRNEALNLWTQLHASVEAKEITVEAGDLLQQWQAYAATPEGQALLLESGSKLRQQSAILGALLTADGTGIIKKELLMAKTSKVGAALKDDADVLTLLNQGSALLSSWSQDELHGKPQAGDDKHDSPSVSSSSSTSRSGAGAGGDALGPEMGLAGDASGAAMKVGEKYLRDLRTTDRGHKLLAKASVLLQTNRELLRPENFVANSAHLAEDLDAREAFITSVKNIALEFLMSYLPTVVVPPINDTRDGVWYEITNIDLGGFQVASEHVTVRIEEDNIIIHASHITCEMKNLLWAYRKLTFPRLSGKGTADANATDIEFALRLKLAYPKEAARHRKHHAEKYSRFTESKTRPRPEDDLDVQDVDEPNSSPEGSPAASAASSRKSSSAILAAGTMGMTDRERSWHAARMAREEKEAAAAAAAAEKRDHPPSSSRPALTTAKSADHGTPPRTPQHLPAGTPPMARPSSGSVGSSSSASHIAAAPAAWSNRTPAPKARPAFGTTPASTTISKSPSQARAHDSAADPPALALGGPPVGRGPSTLSSPLLNGDEEEDAFMLPPTGETGRAPERSTSLVLPPFTPTAAPSSAAASAAPAAAPAPAAVASSSLSPPIKPAIAWGDQAAAAAAANRSRASPALNTPPKADAAASASTSSAASSSSASASAAAPSAPATAAAASTSTAPASPALPPLTGVSPAASRSSAFLEKVSTDIGQPTLVMHSCHLRLNAFAIAIHSGFLKSIYNFLLDLFSDDVKQYLEDTLNYEMGLRSVDMLKQINVLAVDYIPLLQRIMVKATTAAMEDEAAAAGSAKSSAAPSPSLGPSASPAAAGPGALSSKPQSSIVLPAFQPASGATAAASAPPPPASAPLGRSASAAAPSSASAGPGKRVPPAHKPPPPGSPMLQTSASTSAPKSATQAATQSALQQPHAAASASPAVASSAPKSSTLPAASSSSKPQQDEASAALASFYQLPPKPVYGAQHAAAAAAGATSNATNSK